MGIKVVTLCRYIIHSPSTKGWEEWNAFNFVRAIKGDAITGNGTCSIPLGDKRAHFDQSTRLSAFGYFAASVRIALEKTMGIADPWWDSVTRVQRPGVTFMPIPSSCGAVGVDCSEHAPQRLSAACHANMQTFSYVDALRWREPIASAHADDGHRDPDLLEPLVVVTERVAGMRVLLIDDVLTTGGHIRACARALRKAGAHAELAFCVGDTSYENTETPFGVAVHEYDD